MQDCESEQGETFQTSGKPRINCNLPTGAIAVYKKARQYKLKQLITLFFRKKISFSKYLYVSLQLEKRKMRKNK